MGERWSRGTARVVFATLAALTVLWPSLAGAGGGGTAEPRSHASPAPNSDDSPGVATFALLFGVLGAGFGAAALTLQIARARPES